MNDEQLKQLFQSAPKTGYSEEAKTRAIKAALDEFERVHAEQNLKPERPEEKNDSFFQGILNRLRPTVTSQQSPEGKTVNLLKQKWFYSGTATAFVALFGVFLVIDRPIVMTSSSSKSDVVSLETELRTAPEEAFVSAEAPPVPNAADAGGPSRKAELSAPAQEEIVVSGVRGSLSEAHELKREANGVVDAISAEDIGDIPDMRLAESLQRVAKTSQKRELNPVVEAAASVAVASNVNEPPSVAIPQQSRDDFESFDINPIKLVSEEPVSTFSVDVDTASYSFVRRQLNSGYLPNKDAVRIEELVNYFDYAYPGPTNRDQPFASHFSVSDSPWSAGKKLLHIGIQGYDIGVGEQPKSNLVFLLDVSGSMNSPDKLPLVKQSMNLLLSKLRPDDTVAIVVYAGAAGTVLEPTPAKEKGKITAALNRLSAGGSTAGAQGIKLAYQLAELNFDENAVNRIILATDGDFNVGINDREALKGFVERKRDNGIYLSVLGFGQGNYHDHLMQTLAQNGNGVAVYIDTLAEAQKVLVHEATSSLFPIAKDVKVQIEFNPRSVKEYRLVGYETRALKREDFNNDKVDAGDIGAGHSVTAIYEFTPSGSSSASIDELRYGHNERSDSERASEYAFLKLRYKLPDQDTSKLITTAIPAQNTQVDSGLNNEFQFATAVAGFAQLLKDDKYLSEWTYDDALDLAQSHKGADEFGYRSEFVQLIRKAMIANEL